MEKEKIEEIHNKTKRRKQWFIAYFKWLLDLSDTNVERFWLEKYNYDEASDYPGCNYTKMYLMNYIIKNKPIWRNEYNEYFISTLQETVEMYQMVLDLVKEKSEKYWQSKYPDFSDKELIEIINNYVNITLFRSVGGNQNFLSRTQ